jgi:hypothetical protein
MANVGSGRIITGPLPTGTCKRCGAVLPVDVGQSFADCVEWGQQTLAKIPRPCPLDLLLLLRINGQLCVVLSKVNDAGALLAGTVAGDMRDLAKYTAKYGPLSAPDVPAGAKELASQAVPSSIADDWVVEEDLPTPGAAAKKGKGQGHL